MIIIPSRVTATGDRTRLTVLSDHISIAAPGHHWCRLFWIMAHQMHKDTERWQQMVDSIREEFRELSASKRFWLQQRAESIAAIQVELDRLFEAADGSATCRTCLGDCCGCGRHHVTLTNLLTYLLEDETPPTPDFSKPCPFLGEQGCQLPVARRPYNCITFFCEQLEESLGAEDQKQLRTLDVRLRQEYEAVAARYPVASLRGLWIAMERRGKRDIFSRSDEDMIE